MKTKSKLFMALLILISIGMKFSFAGDGPKPDVLTKFAVGFIENKGQLRKQGGLSANNVFCKLNMKHSDIYFTDRGVDYIFYRTEEEQSDGMEPSIDISVDREVKYSRTTLELLNGTFSKDQFILENPIEGGKEIYYIGDNNNFMELSKFSKLTIKNVYPGIDWVFECSNETLKYDFIVHPYANPADIKMVYKGGKKFQTEVDDNSIHVKTRYGSIIEGNLISYQENLNNVISSKFIKADDMILFEVADYDKSKPLIIDPPIKLLWSTYFGGTGNDGPQSVSSDANGNIFVSGYTTGNLPFPIGGYVYDGTLNGPFDGFISKFDVNGVQQWTTYFGGSGEDRCLEVAVDNNGFCYVVGHTNSPNFPVTTGAQINGGNTISAFDGFIAKFDGTGHLVWSTFVGDAKNQYVTSVATDNVGNVVCSGYGLDYTVPYLPLGSEYYQNPGINNNDAFILKFTGNGSLFWGTSYGGSGADLALDICVDFANNIFVTGETQSTQASFPLLLHYDGTHNGQKDMFILKFDPSGIHKWATYFGGNGHDIGYGIACDVSGSIYLTGSTLSSNFPILGGASTNGGSGDGFVIKFVPALTLNFSRYLGGSSGDVGNEIVVDPIGNIFVIGKTGSSNFPVMNQVPAPVGIGNYFGTKSGLDDAFITMFNASKVMKWSTFYGGSGSDWANGVAVNGRGCLFVTGEWTPPSNVVTLNPGGGAFYSSTGSGNDDGFILKFCPDCNPVPYANAGSFESAPICPGTTVTIGDVAMANEGLTIAWFPFKGTPAALINVAPLTTTTYTVVTTDPLTGCYNSDQVTIVVGATAVADAGVDLALTSFCTTGTNTGVLGVPGNPNFSYSWSSNPASGLAYLSSTSISNPTIVYPGGTADMNIVYTLTVTCGSTSAQDQVNVHVHGCRIMNPNGQNEISDLNVDVSPNPITKDFTLTVSSSDGNDNYSFEVLSLSGKVVHKEDGVNVNVPRVVSLMNLRLDNGLYFIKVYCGNKSKTIKVEIIN